MIINFTYEVVTGLWTREILVAVRQLVRPGGILVQEAGTMLYKGGLSCHLKDHARAFSTVCPLAPYFLLMSTDAPTDVNHVDGSFLGKPEHCVAARCCSPRVHQKILAYPADFGQAFALSPSPKLPLRWLLILKVRLDSPKTTTKIGRGVEKNDGVEERSGARKIIALCRSRGAKCLSLAIYGEEVLSKVTLHLDKSGGVARAQAPNVLGQRGFRVFVLGGGTGSMAFLAQQYPQVENIVVVELDVDVVNFAKKVLFPAARSLLRPADGTCHWRCSGVGDATEQQRVRCDRCETCAESCGARSQGRPECRASCRLSLRARWHHRAGHRQRSDIESLQATVGLASGQFCFSVAHV